MRMAQRHLSSTERTNRRSFSASTWSPENGFDDCDKLSTSSTVGPHQGTYCQTRSTSGWVVQSSTIRSAEFLTNLMS
jgi:hypothetical protein